ncbi:hypothetical protein ABTK87_19280, partial [Acinetobacter baumannii]
SAFARSQDQLPTVTVTQEQPRKRKPRAAVAPTPPAAAPARAATSPRADDRAVPASVTLPPDAGINRALSSSDSASLVTDLPGGAAWGAGGVS